MKIKSDLEHLRDIIFAEADDDEENMRMIGSTVLNRMEAKKGKEFGSNIPEIIKKGYYGISNPQYKLAEGKTFSDIASAMKFKKAHVIAEKLLSDKKYRSQGMFYFTPEEEEKLKVENERRIKNKQPHKFNFGVVKLVGKTKRYNVYSY